MWLLFLVIWLLNVAVSSKKVAMKWSFVVSSSSTSFVHVMLRLWYSICVLRQSWQKFFFFPLGDFLGRAGTDTHKYYTDIRYLYIKMNNNSPVLNNCKIFSYIAYTENSLNFIKNQILGREGRVIVCCWDSKMFVNQCFIVIGPELWRAKKLWI